MATRGLLKVNMMANHTPDMLAALKEAERLLTLTHGEPPFFWPPHIKKTQPTRVAAWEAILLARDAIAKAEGRT